VGSYFFRSTVLGGLTALAACWTNSFDEGVEFDGATFNLVRLVTAVVLAAFFGVTIPSIAGLGLVLGVLIYLGGDTPP